MLLTLNNSMNYQPEKWPKHISAFDENEMRESMNRIVPFVWRNRRPRLMMALLVCISSGCASLPEVDYLHDRSFAPERNPTIVNAKGELAATKKDALLERMVFRTGQTDILQKHIIAEEAISGAPLVAGNKVELLSDGPATMRAMMTAIRSARNHINLETYIFEADHVGQALADLLMEKRAAGVTVNLIYDSVGALDTPRAFFNRMRDAGIAILEYNPINPLQARGDWDINQRDHRKLLVVDGKIAFTGGVNISKVYGKSAFFSGSRKEPVLKDAKQAAWRDTHMQIEGPAVAEFQKLFLDTWQRKTGQEAARADYFPPLKKEGSALVRAIGSAPDMANYAVYKTYISAFAHADKYIHVTTAYFVPDRDIVQAMLDAARRGVDVKVIFPSFTDVGLVLHAGRSYYEELLRGGIKIYERKQALLHAKTAVIDGVWSTIGSTNLDMRSFLHNDELNAVVLSPDFAEKMEALFERDLKQSSEITLSTWAQRSFGDRVKEWAARMLAYWL